MKRFHWAHMIITGAFVFSLGACVHKPTKPLESDQPMSLVSSPTQHEVLLQEARVESENLRAEIASLKILMAKQAGELRSLREQSQSVQHREQDQGIQLQQVRSELLSSQAERDQLKKRNVELEGQVASMPDTAQLVTDIQTLSSSFQQIMTAMKQLTTDITLIKREMHISTDKLNPRQTKLSTSKPESSPQTGQTPDAQGRIVIQDGDTLWKLARTFGVSIEQLKEWNRMESDLIMTGLRLKVAEPGESSSPAAPAAVESAIPTVIQEQVLEPVQDNIPPTTNRVENAPEPKHILSLGSPPSKSE